MNVLLWILAIQGLLGAFDTLYHHELTERLPWRATAGRELMLHGVRNFFYILVFLSLGWVEWRGIFAWIFAIMLLVEVFITLWDFIEEDRTRALPATERVTHTILALNYGAIITLFFPHWLQWAVLPSGFARVSHGWLSWVMALYAAGLMLWSLRDLMASRRLKRIQARRAAAPALPILAPQRILITGGTGFIGQPLCRSLIAQGHQLTILARDFAKAGKMFQGRVTLIDALERLGAEDAFDSIINLAGEPVSQRWTDAARVRIQSSRHGVTQGLLDYIARARVKPQLFLHGSAIGAYGLSEAARFDEASLSVPDESFAQQVCLAHEADVAGLEVPGMRLCILRTGIVLETEGGALAQMLFPFEFGVGGKVGSGRQIFSWIHREDLLSLILTILQDSRYDGIVNGVAPEPVTQNLLARRIGKALCRPSLAPLPGFVVRLLFGQMGQELLLSGQHVSPGVAQRHGFTFRHPTLGPALREMLG